jgi:Ca2+:H+ antiporter
LVLTFSAVAVEILLLFMIVLQASSHSTQALETVKGGIISAVLVDMNVILGLAVFVGGLNFKEQEHNEDTSSSYTTILLVSAAILLVPSILSTTSHQQDDILLASYLIGGLLFSFYFIIFIFQTKTHIDFFKATARSRILRFKKRRKLQIHENEEGDDYFYDKLTPFQNFIAIFIFIFIIGILAEIFANDGIKVMSEFGIGSGIAGIFIAIVAVAPELFTAIKAAVNDQIQRVINIAMGASVVSILLTVPALLVLSASADINLLLDFNPLQIGALILTIILAWKTTLDGETNYLEGIAHLVFFLAYAIIAGFY